MRVKRFEGKNEQAILAEIRAEMGPNATVVSTRSKPYPLPFGWFMKPKLVVTAAYESDETFTPKEEVPTPPILQAARDALKTTKNEDSIEESLSLLLQEARKATLKTEAIAEESKPEPSPPPENKPASKKNGKNKNKTLVSAAAESGKFNNPLVQTFYDTLISQDVLPEVAIRLLGDLANIAPTQTDVKEIVKVVYANIVELLSDPTLVNPEKPAPQTVVFMGPTGVGKTTTIAKLSSLLALNHDLRVGLVTADTYRIAAVEQLKTYADILGLEIRTVYKPEEAADQVNSLMPPNDIVLIDTAGRSHKNKENLAELKQVLDGIPDSVRYLVLSVATRYRELASIVNTYATITDFDLIFTKLDESDTLGNLVNLCCLTGKKPAYITFGQSVPEDFDAIKPDNIAKSLLGLTGEVPYGKQEGGPE
ncbi:MAG: flagellar biosynthesis protein FlhF [Defluviitaleaceae bacterium]|nr:flagellar biosynthesis protein FlhF [Defluviitaleaceae bacterium]MCL2238660.1 flagellar biosynthesis protein FlhF [Defluviitaleaceae bacterium]